MAYIYQADVYCDDCGAAICDELDAKGEAPENTDDEYSYDSDDYPKEADDNDEADTPQHCGHCHKPFGNPLTTYGVNYVLEHIKESLNTPADERNKVHDCYKGTWYEGSRHVAIVRDWAEDLQWYNLNEADKDLVDKFLEETES
jgi:hypothetical protein